MGEKWVAADWVNGELVWMKREEFESSIYRDKGTIPGGHVGEVHVPMERQYRSVYGGPWKAYRDGQWVEVDE